MHISGLPEVQGRKGAEGRIWIYTQQDRRQIWRDNQLLQIQEIGYAVFFENHKPYARPFWPRFCMLIARLYCVFQCAKPGQ